ncbi:MAG: hypothetical protein WD359_01880 [Dehalococcoidia bacterium]
MTAGAAIVVAFRLVVPLLIFRHPLAGGIAALIADAIDVVLISVMQLGDFGGHYHTTDKLLDSYYLAIEWTVAFGWDSPWARWPALVLFPYRIIGVALFETTGERVMLFIFPNMFGNWWLYCLLVARFFPSIYPRSLRTTAVPMLLLLIPKMAQEYVLHYREAQPWDWMQRNIFGID